MMTPTILFEDKDSLVIDKPAGLVVHEGNGSTGATLTDWLAKHLPRSPLKHQRFGLVHRLDKDTSGVMVIAKTADNLAYLINLFRQRQVHKEYLTLVTGHLTPKRGIIKIPVGRDMVRRTRFAPSDTGKLAETRYEVISYPRGLTYLRVQPTTGRTHQIRVHLSSLGYPIVGDRTYGRAGNLSRQFLHAHKLSFVGLDGHRYTFTTPLPTELKAYLDGLK